MPTFTQPQTGPTPPAVQFTKAIKRNAKLRLGLGGPAGSGKTYTLLTLATALGGRTAYVDTEHGSASKYADLFQFDVIEPDTFDPRDLIDFIDAAVAAGYSNCCIDSLSHYWVGPGGELEMVDNVAKRIQGNSFAAWKHVTPIHNALIDKILSAPIHILVGVRTKTEWVVDKDDKGKNVPRKIGLAPVMRDQIEYEFDVYGDMDSENTLTVTKSRCPQLTGKVINRPGKEMAATLRTWLGTDTPPAIAAPPVAIATPKPEAKPAASAPAGVSAEIGALWSRMTNLSQICAEYAKLKTAMKDFAGTNHDYYTILGRGGMEHANDAKRVGMRAARGVARELYETLHRWQALDAPPAGGGEDWVPDFVPDGKAAA